MDAVSLHRMLLRIAGWADDALVATARAWLAEGRFTDVAQVVRYAAVSGRIPMLSEDIDALKELDESGAAPVIDRVDRLVLPCVRFTADPPDAAPTETPALDRLDETAVTGIEHDAEGVAAGVWRAWRAPALPTPWPPPRRVFLVQVDGAVADGPLPALVAARRQEVLAHAGEPSPQVEVFTDPDQLPPYQRAALATATLLWGRHGTAPLALAPVFDPIDQAARPGFAAADGTGRVPLEPGEREAVLTYLERGGLVLASPTRLDDVIDTSSIGTVPAGFRSDGTWVWSEASAYYLRRHGIAPPAALVEHIRRTGAPPGLDAAGRHRALAALRAAAVAGGLG